MAVVGAVFSWGPQVFADLTSFAELDAWFTRALTARRMGF